MCVSTAQRAVEKVVSTHQKDSDLVARASSNGGSEESLLAQQSEIFNTVTRLLQQTGDVCFCEKTSVFHLFL